MRETNGHYSTEDLTLAAYLVSIQQDLLEVRSRGYGRAAFIFPDSPSLKAAITNFFNRRASVEPRTFAETIRTLKGAAREGETAFPERETRNAAPPR